MAIPVNPELLIVLRRSANQAMWQEWRAANPPGKRVYEVACIRNLVEKALPRVQQAWAPALGALGISVTLTGVMCHGRPFVSFPGASRSCELGDLLLVHDHQLGQGAFERRAAVIQAKVFGSGGVTCRNDIQLTLYRRWPQFTYLDWPGHWKPCLKATNSPSLICSSGISLAQCQAPTRTRQLQSMRVVGTE